MGQPHGHGKFIMSDGTIYEGGMWQGKAEGKGK